MSATRPGQVIVRNQSGDIVGVADLAGAPDMPTQYPLGKNTLIAVCSVSLSIEIKSADFYTVVLPDGKTATVQDADGDQQVTIN